MNVEINDKILQTALAQFLKFGIREMSIQKLVAPLNISTKTVYKHFKNKEELLEAVLRYHYNQQYKLFEELIGVQNTVALFYDIWYYAVEREYGVNNAFFRDLHYYYPALERKIEVEIGNKFWQKILQLVKKGIQQGYFSEEIIPEVMMEGIAVLLDKIGRSEQFLKFKITHREIFQNTISIYIKGFCTTKGLQELENHIAKKYDLTLNK